jgi:uracil-DNA glycosylase
MDKALQRDVARYLSQKAERDFSIIASPADGVEAIDSVTTEQDQMQELSSSPANQQTKQAETRYQPTEDEKSMESVKGNRGAPEPEFQAEDQTTLVDPFPSYTELDAFNQAILGCQKCALGANRNKLVFGVGDQQADLVLIGEAPGAEEDRLGEPFVGRAGKLLDQILAAVDLKRGDGVYIANILKCRPPNNRDPQTTEVHDCEPHLLKQLQLINPKLIVALGRIAAQTLLRTNESLTKLREQELQYHGIPLIVTYHPAALLRNPNWKRPTWEDVQKMKRMLDEMRG